MERDIQRVAWVTGASSGVGAEAARRLARQNMRVVVSARRTEKLDELVAELTAEGHEITSVHMDAADLDGIADVHRRVRESGGVITDLVCAAGTNAPERLWRNQDMATFDQIMQTNLSSTARVIDQVLPGMRELGLGTVTVVSSFAAWRFQPVAGVAYSAAKTGLKSLCEMLNGQEKAAGIRATHLCPGDIATAFLDQRPEVPDESARETMLTPDDVARTVEFVHTNPLNICVDELVVTPVGRA